MARMIPAQIYSGNPSPGEKEIFHRFANDPNTEGWIILHSLDIANHIKRVSGEADFVIIVPHKGILCLEVKATSRVRREDGLWYYGSNSNPDMRGPFKQSSEAMYSIRRRLLKGDTSLQNIPFWSAVIFPYLEFSISSDEWHHWQVIDNNDFRRQSISSLMLKVLNNARKFLEKNRATWFTAASNEPTNNQCSQIARILRPDFEFYEPPRNKIERLEQEVKKYTTEQFIALDAMAANPRVVFSGPAGTGKTILAIEAARRSHAEGNRVLFLCYNRLLGQFLESEISTIQPRVTVSTLHKHMLNVANAKLAEQSQLSGFWLEDLPNRAIEKLLDDITEKHLYDEIIIDEAQDLLRNSYLDFIDLSLKGGLNSGKWKLFGDFEKQAIYGSNAEISIGEATSTRFGRPPQYTLRINCRNTPRIVALVHLLGDLNPKYSKILRPDDGVESEIAYYADSDGQIKHLLNAVRRLKQEGFTNSDIIVLSTKSLEKSIISAMNPSELVKFVPFESASKKRIGCGSIYSFKGMESPAIIVTDVENITSDQAVSLFYIAMTRALHRLYVLAHSNIKDDILEKVLLS